LTEVEGVSDTVLTQCGERVASIHYVQANEHESFSAVSCSSWLKSVSKSFV
jgi:hypothetical protein